MEKIGNITLTNGDCMGYNHGEVWLPVNELWSFTSGHNKERLYKFPKGKYFVSNMGRFMVNKKIVDSKIDAVGTKTFCMCRHRFKLHQIILQTFDHENIKDGFSVDHINRNRLDNRLVNLRWANHNVQSHNRENISYKYKKVFCIDNGKIYDSCQDAEINLNLVKNTVSRVARGERKSIHGYHFKFV